jgi:GTPase
VSKLRSVVIAGRPNVGKSTLFNRLLGRRKALVHDQPGVTRDLNLALVERDGVRLQIVDTGGILGGSEDTMANLVEDQVEVALSAGDRILLIVDAKEGLLPVEKELARHLIKAGKPAALVVNKVDVASHFARSAEFHELGLSPLFTVSAEHGSGIEELWAYMAEGVAPEEEAAEAKPDQPIRVAIVGKPNVGKSSLLNRLLGEERALVSDVPGTTRDPVDSLLVSEGREFLLVDTAGIRRKGKTGHAAELLSVILARRSLQDCHVALLVLDASMPPTHQDAHILGLTEEARRGAVLVLNKWDLVRGEERAKEIQEAITEKFIFMDYLPRVRTSAKTGRHVDHVLRAVLRAYGNFAQSFPTATLNRTLHDIVSRVSPPSVQGKELKIRYATQTGQAPPILTLFTNSKFPPPDAYTRYLKNRLRQAYDLEGSPLILKYRKE